MKWRFDVRTGNWVSGDYECLRLTGRGGWRSWSVYRAGQYVANAPRLALAKAAAERVAGSWPLDSLRSGDDAASKEARMDRMTQEDALMLVHKYGPKSATTDPEVVKLAKSYTQLVELCRKGSENAEQAHASISKILRALGDGAGL